jgi:coatomer protein complex subunit epsilon
MANPPSDGLFEMRNAFYLGNFQATISEALKSRSQSLEKDMLMYRAYLAQKKYGVVLDEVSASRGAELLAVRLLASYLSGDSDTRTKIADDLEKRLASVGPGDYVQLLVGATIYFTENNYEAALRLLHNSDHLECSAMMLQMYLKLDRIDLARKELKRMQERDDDATLTQLAQAWLNLAVGGEKLQEAFYIFQELSDKYGATPLLLNGQAVALMNQGKFEEAEALVQQAVDKDNNNPETLVNLVVLSQHLGKAPEVANRYLSQMRDSNHGHPFVADLKAKESELGRLLKQYAIPS